MQRHLRDHRLGRVVARAVVDRAAGARAVVPEEVAVPEGAVAVAAVAAVASPEAPGSRSSLGVFPTC